MIDLAEMDIKNVVDTSYRPDARRLFFHGLPLGIVDVDVTTQEIDGKEVYVGHGPEPSNRWVNSRMRADQFDVGQEVVVWWWGVWWFATVRRITRSGRLALRFNWNKKEVSKFLPRLIYPL